MSKILKAAHELFEEFNKNDILYCHWKSNEHLYEGLIGETDLDVIVHPDCKEKAKEKLFETGYIQLSSQYGSNYPDVEDWITCDEETGKLIHIHLHFRMASRHDIKLHMLIRLSMTIYLIPIFFHQNDEV